MYGEYEDYQQSYPNYQEKPKNVTKYKYSEEVRAEARRKLHDVEIALKHIPNYTAPPVLTHYYQREEPVIPDQTTETDTKHLYRLLTLKTLYQDIITEEERN